MVELPWIVAKSNATKVCISSNWPRCTFCLYDITFVDDIFIIIALHHQILHRFGLLKQLNMKEKKNFQIFIIKFASIWSLKLTFVTIGSENSLTMIFNGNDVRWPIFVMKCSFRFLTTLRIRRAVTSMLHS